MIFKGKTIADKEKELASYEGEDKVVSLQEIDEQEKQNAKPEIKVMSRMTYLDSLIDGFEAGELIVVSGLPKAGKTLLLQTFTWEFGGQGVLSLWFSYELTARQFVSRFPGYPTLPVTYMPRKLTSNAMEWIEDRIVEGKVKYGIKAVMIDHLHYIVDMERLRNPSLEIGSVLRKLKQLAISHNVIVFLVAHTGKVKDKTKPTGADIRDSSFVLQEPDTVLIIYRIDKVKKKVVENQARLVVEVSRRVGTLKKEVKLIKHHGGLLGELKLPDIKDETDGQAQ